MSPFPPTKYGRAFFIKKFSVEEKTSLDKFLAGCFTWGLMIRYARGKLMVKSFQRTSQVSFPRVDPDLGYWYIIWKVNTTNRGLNLKNTFCTLCLWGWGFHVNLSSLFKTFYCWPVLRYLNYRAVVGLRIYGSDS